MSKYGELSYKTDIGSVTVDFTGQMAAKCQPTPMIRRETTSGLVFYGPSMTDPSRIKNLTEKKNSDGKCTIL